MKKLVGLLSVLLVLGFAGAVVGLPVYQQPVMESPRGVISDAGALDTVWADNFMLAEDTMITDVHWWGFYGGGILPDQFPPFFGDAFTIQFYTGAMPFPEPAPLHEEWAGHVGRTDTGFGSGSGETVYYYEYDLGTPIQLYGGVQYYLSIYNSTAVHNWFWAEGTGGDPRLWRKSYPDPYMPWDLAPPMFPLAFELTGYPTGTVIPEPITSLLFVGSVGLGLLRRRRKQS